MEPVVEKPAEEEGEEKKKKKKKKDPEVRKPRPPNAPAPTRACTHTHTNAYTPPSSSSLPPPPFLLPSPPSPFPPSSTRPLPPAILPFSRQRVTEGLKCSCASDILYIIVRVCGSGCLTTFGGHAPPLSLLTSTPFFYLSLFSSFSFSCLFDFTFGHVYRLRKNTTQVEATRGVEQGQHYLAAWIPGAHYTLPTSCSHCLKLPRCCRIKIDGRNRLCSSREAPSSPKPTSRKNTSSTSTKPK